MVVLPLAAASLLTWREAGRSGVRRLLSRAGDYPRIRDRRWYLPILLTMPAALAVQYAWLRLSGAPVSAPGVTLPMLAAYFLVFVAAAAGEEVGWSGYALDPLQRRWGALGAAVVIGTVWALWHLIPYALANPPLWVAGQAATTVLIRVLMVWVYNNTGASVFGQVLFHATTNMVTVPDYGFAYDPVAMSAVLGAMAGAVVLYYGPATLARTRPPSPR
jgi:membrane protease YdiL (CAAX protease family)